MYKLTKTVPVSMRAIIRAYHVNKGLGILTPHLERRYFRVLAAIKMIPSKLSYLNILPTVHLYSTSTIGTPRFFLGTSSSSTSTPSTSTPSTSTPSTSTTSTPSTPPSIIPSPSTNPSNSSNSSSPQKDSFPSLKEFTNLDQSKTRKAA